MSEFKELKLTDLAPSPTNPRTDFNAESLQELAESIKQHGILQPIIVRPGNIVGKAGNKTIVSRYEIVAGERRYRAAVLAGLEFIPASVRELTDDEVFEIQIVENLERKDVHPMDEAVAFKKMLESGKYTMQDIAAKVAKTETFVAQRLKLNDLIPELKEDFQKGEFGIGHAVLMARVSDEQQREIFEESKSQWNPGYGSVQKLKNKIDGRGIDLDEAVFGLMDSSLLPEAGACTKCPKCSLSNPILFPEYEEQLCFDKGCFNKKTELFKIESLEKIIDENPGIILTANYLPDFLKPVAIAAETLGKKIYEGFEDYGCAEFDTDGAIKSFDIRTWEFGFVKLRNNSKSSDHKNPLADELSNLKSKAERNLELDREKIYKRALTEIVKDKDKNSKMLSSDPLLEDEKKALALAIISYADDEWIKKEYGVSLGYNDRHKQIDKIWSDEFFAKLIRHKIQRELITENFADFEKQDRPAYMMQIFKHYFPKEIEMITLEQNDVAKKRIAKSDARIAELERQISEK